MNKPVLRIPLIAFAVGVLGYLACFLVPVRYQGTETLYFPMAQPSSMSALSALGGGKPQQGDPGSISLLGNALSTPLPGAAPATAAGIIRSYSSMKNVVTTCDLVNKWHTDMGGAFKRVEAELQADTDPETGFLTVTFQDHDRELAVKAIAVALDYLNKSSNSLAFNVGKQNRIFIQSRLDNANKLLNDREKVLIADGQKSPLAATELVEKNYFDAQSNLVLTEATLEGDRRKISAISQSLDQLYSSGASATLASTPAATNANAELTAMARELTARRLALEDAMSTFQEGAAQLKAAKRNFKSAETVNATIATGLKKGVAGKYDPLLIQANSEADALQATAHSYKVALAQLKADLTSSANQSVQMLRAKADFESAQANVNKLEQELAIAKIAEERDPSRYEVLDAAHLDPNFSYPKKGLIAGTLFILAIIVQLIPRLRHLVVLES